MSRVQHATIILERPPSRVRGRCIAARCEDAKTEGERVDDAQLGAVAEAAARQRDDELQTLLAAICDSVAEAERSRRQSIDELQELAIELATLIAGELVFRTIDADEHDVAGMVTAAITQLGVDTPLTLTLHPTDLARLNTLVDNEEAPHAWRNSDITLQAEIKMLPGHCRASSGAVTLLSEIAPRLEEIRRLLWEGLDDAQDERRQTANVDSPLKRFPDRRETA